MYVIANINANPTPVQTYDIQPAPTYLVFQASANVPALAGGAVGLGLDDNSGKLFITYEGSNTIQLVDATNFSVLTTVSAPSASNLAGIVVDQGNNKIYTVDRETNHLYVYSWTSATNTLTLDGGAFKTLTGVSKANGIALDETRGRLYIGDRDSTTVRYFSTSAFSGGSTLTEAGNIDLSAEGQTVMGIAIDSVRNILYTGNAYQPYGSRGKLVKYNLNTSAISSYTLPGASPTTSSGDNIVGIAVDEDTGYVYVTTGNQGSGGTDTIIVFDSNLTVLKNDIADIGNPTGIAIPRAQVSYNPLNFTKMEDSDPVASGNNLTYTLCFDNSSNATAVTNVVITDNIPAGTTFVSATGPIATTPTTVTWTIANVAAGAPQVCYALVVNVTAASGSTILNSATIDSTETPPTSVTASTTVSTSGGGGTVTFAGKGDGGTASTSPIEILFGLMALPMILARRFGKRLNLLFLASGIVVAFTLAASTYAFASDKGNYYGLDMGLSRTDVTGGRYDNDLAALGYTTSSSIDRNSLGWRVFIGHNFNKTWAVEGGYVNLGDVKSSTVVSSPALPTAVEQQQFVDKAATVHPYSIDALTLVGKGTWSINKDVSVFGKAGMFAWKADILVRCVGCATSVSAPDGETGTDWTVGFGALYRYSKSFNLRMQYDRYNTNRHDIDFYSVGFQADF